MVLWLIKGIAKSFQTFLNCLELRELLTNQRDNDLYNKYIVFKKSQKLKGLVWHRNCYSSFTSKRNIDHLEKKLLKERETEHRLRESSSFGIGVSSLRKKNFIIERCVVCQKLSKIKKVSQLMTTNADRRIRMIADKNPTIFERIGANDLIAMEVKFHVSCFLSQWKKIKGFKSNQEKSLNP